MKSKPIGNFELRVKGKKGWVGGNNRGLVSLLLSPSLSLTHSGTLLLSLSFPSFVMWLLHVKGLVWKRERRYRDMLNRHGCNFLLRGLWGTKEVSTSTVLPIHVHTHAV